jgi:salicylate hydroxylase
VGKHKGEQLFELPAGIISVMRSKWLEELLRHLPKDCLHPNKKLVSLTQPPEGSQERYILHFEDGTTHEADAVIGCDGIRSKVRDIVLGSENKAVFGGYWDACARMSPQKAAEQFGTELFDPFKPVEVALIGEGASMLFVPNTNGEVYNVIVAAAAKDRIKSSDWKIELTREFLEDAFSAWDVDFRNTVIDIILSSESGAGVVYTQWESPFASTYYRSRLCIMGDSAHSTIPWLGQGACMAMEDAAVLARLVGQLKSSTDLEAAFETFDHIRRGRPEHIMTQSREAAKVLTGQMGLDPAKLKLLNVPEWWKSIWSFDMDSHIQEAINHFQLLTS